MRLFGVFRILATGQKQAEKKREKIMGEWTMNNENAYKKSVRSTKKQQQKKLLNFSFCCFKLKHEKQIKRKRLCCLLHKAQVIIVLGDMAVEYGDASIIDMR